MTDQELIRRCDVLEILDNEGSLGRTRKLVEQLVAVTNEAQAAEIERLRGDIERGLSVAKEIEKACRGLRDEAQPMTAKDATRLIIAALKGATQ
jgi:hypothetical protein